jgi:hypothetical protein
MHSPSLVNNVNAFRQPLKIFKAFTLAALQSAERQSVTSINSRSFSSFIGSNRRSQSLSPGALLLGHWWQSLVVQRSTTSLPLRHIFRDQTENPF